MGDSLSALYLQNPELAIQLRRRRMAEQLQQAGTDASPVKHPLEAVSRLAQALLGAYGGYKSDQEMSAIGEKQDARRKEYMSGIPEPSQSALSGMPAMVAGQNIPPPAPVAGMRPFTAANLPNGIDPATDQIVRTVWGEAAGEPPEGQRGVAAVIQNRMKQSGQDATSVIFKPNQFEPWNNPATRAKLEGLDPNSPEYQRILANIAPVLGGVAPDPTNGATHFYSPTAQAALGRETPSWATGQAQDIGRHRFYNIGYQPDSGAPGAPSSVLPPTMIGATPTVTPGIDVGAMQNRAAQLRARGNAGLGDRDPLIRSRAQGFISEADRLDRLAEQERVRVDARAARAQDRADAQANRNVDTVQMMDPGGKSVGLYATTPTGVGRRLGDAPKQPGEGGAFAGTGMEAQANNTLLSIGPKMEDGTATKEERGQYALAYEHLANGRIMPVPDPTDPTGQRQVLARIPGAVPAQFPNPNGSTGTAGPGVIPGTTKPAPQATEEERKVAGFSIRLQEAGKSLNALEDKGVHTGNTSQALLGAIPGIGNFLLKPEYQVYQQQAEDWVRSKLRRESGASIGDQEAQNEIKTYFPQPGDSPEKIAAKRRSRLIAEAGMKVGAGRVEVTVPPAPSTPEPPPGFKVIQ